ncbi:hypothetical protein B9Z55_014071 [Caenorhabditis nigoni]|uniref:Uncharacterized protein n=1 Tax=Caenorhabditis nigoni TaxID=1611254 RepID=A0A2G5U587_9PELO|nr:hypothetical protein B9Z55_014071 [Caenorhabditis nigoni]
MSSSFSTDFDASNMLKPSSSQMFGPIDIHLPRKDSRHHHHMRNLRARLAPERLCFGTMRPQTAAYLICIAALHEITFGQFNDDCRSFFRMESYRMTHNYPD